MRSVAGCLNLIGCCPGRRYAEGSLEEFSPAPSSFLIDPVCLPVMSSFPKAWHLVTRDLSLVQAQTKPKGLENVTTVLTSSRDHPAGQQVLASATPFCPELIQYLRMRALSKDHLFTLLLKEPALSSSLLTSDSINPDTEGCFLGGASS